MIPPMLGDVCCPRETAEVGEVIVQAVPVLVMDHHADRHLTVGLFPHDDGSRQPEVRFGHLHPSPLIPSLRTLPDPHRSYRGAAWRRDAQAELRAWRPAHTLRRRVERSALQRSAASALVRTESCVSDLGALAVEGTAAYLTDERLTGSSLRRAQRRRLRAVARTAFATEHQASGSATHPIGADVDRLTASSACGQHALDSSGTTLQVATRLGREAIGIDLDPRNEDLVRERVGMFLEEVEHV